MSKDTNGNPPTSPSSEQEPSNIRVTKRGTYINASNHVPAQSLGELLSRQFDKIGPIGRVALTTFAAAGIGAVLGRSGSRVLS